MPSRTPVTTTTFLERYACNVERIGSQFENRRIWRQFPGAESQVASVAQKGSGENASMNVF